MQGFWLHALSERVSSLPDSIKDNVVDGVLSVWPWSPSSQRITTAARNREEKKWMINFRVGVRTWRWLHSPGTGRDERMLRNPKGNKTSFAHAARLWAKSRRQLNGLLLKMLFLPFRKASH